MSVRLMVMDGGNPRKRSENLPHPHRPNLQYYVVGMASTKHDMLEAFLDKDTGRGNTFDELFI